MSIERSYPTSNGVPRDPNDIGLGLNPEKHPERITNHHGSYPESTYETVGGFLLLKIFRNLEANQYLMWESVHNMGKSALHSVYTPPEPPTPSQAMDFVVAHYETDNILRYGTAVHPEYRKISSRMMRKIDREYNNLT